MNKPICVLQSSLFVRSGYGGLSMAVAKALLKYDKFDLHIIPTRWGACPSKTSESELIDPLEKELFRKILRGPLPRKPEVYIQVTIPNEFQPQGQFNIGYTAGIETTMPSGPFVEGMCRMDLNLVTSTFVKDVFANVNYSKQHPDGKKEPLVVTKPMEVLPWGADTNLYKKTDVISPSVDKIMSGISEDFNFLFVGQWTHSNGLYSDRKDIGTLIKTFCKAFEHTKNRPGLILKTSGVNFSVTDKYECLKRIKDIQKDSGVSNPPNVYLIHGELTDEEMNSLYNHPKVKVNINFTHGEGFGHPLLLATLSGKPLLVSNWSGHLDFLNSEHTGTNLLRGELKLIDPSSVNEWLIKEGAWFNVNIDNAIEKMRGVVVNYDKLLEKAEKLRLDNQEKFSILSMENKLYSLFDKYLPTFALEQQLVLPKLKKINLPSLAKV